MNPLHTLEKAKEWAHNRAKIYSEHVKKIHFVVCKHNDGYIVHNAKFIYDHKNEYSSDELVYCTNHDEFKTIISVLRLFQKDE